MTTVVKFTASYPPYSTDDIAGFDDDFATRLIDRGVAVHHASDSEVQAARAAQDERNRRGAARPAVLVQPEGTQETAPAASTSESQDSGTGTDTTPGTQPRRTTVR